MNKQFFSPLKAIAFVSLAVALSASCEYKEIADFPFTQNVYLPAAGFASFGAGANGLYVITPSIQGQPYRYLADKATNKFNVPLSVSRTAVNPSGGVQVNLATNADTVIRLITAGKFVVPGDPSITTEVLPTTAYTLPNEISIPDGGILANFNLSIDLAFLSNSVTATPKKRYAIGVGITGAGKSVDSLKRLAVIFIDPVAVLIPVANFTTFVDNAYKTVGVINISQNGTTYSWNYGDGTAVSTAVSESHKYAASGTYTITLTATGITGATSIRTASITIL